MESQEKKSKWDELARQLGAEAPAESEHPRPVERETVEESASRVEERPAKPKPSAPKRSASDWAKLTSDLGLPPIEIVEPERPASLPPAARQQSPSGEERTPPPRTSAAAPPASERDPPRGSDREDGPRGGHPRRSRGTRGGSGRNRDEREQRGERSSRGGRERRPARDDTQHSADHHGAREHRERRDRERAEPRERRPLEEQVEPDNRPTSHRAELTPPLREEPRPESESVREPEPKPSAGVSLWHKIFGMPAEQTAKLTETEEKRHDADQYEPPDRGPASEEVRFASEAEVDQFDSEFIDDVESREGATESGKLADGESDEDRRGRPRRRRRGGRGRGSRSSEGEQSERGDRPQRSPRDDRGGRSSRRSKREDRSSSSRQVEDAGSPDDEFDDLDDIGPDESDIADDDFGSEVDGGEAVEQGNRSRSSAGHRNIPTWDDAIGMIVDGNLASRPQRRRATSSPRSGSQRGGRSRGGRSRGGGRSGGARSNGGNRTGEERRSDEAI